MTPTRDQLDAVLTRSSAGVSALTGDLDDPDERARALDWLEKTIREAVTVRQRMIFLADPELEALLDEEEAIARGDRTAHMSARVSASNDWPPPRKGSHESDLFFWRPAGTCDDWNEWSVASRWSRTPDDRSST